MSANRALWRHGPSSRRRRRAAAADTNVDESVGDIYQCVLRVYNIHCRDCRRYLGKAVSMNPCDGCEYNEDNWSCDTWLLPERQDHYVSGWRCYYCVYDALQILMRSETSEG